MKYQGRRFSLSVGIIVFASSCFAAEPLTGEAIESLIAGNTVEGKGNRGDKISWFFDESGVAKKLNHDRNMTWEGSWSIDSENRLCVRFKPHTAGLHRKMGLGKLRCRNIVPRDDGGYDAIGTEHPEAGQRRAIWKKLLSGNPHNL